MEIKKYILKLLIKCKKQESKHNKFNQNNL